MSRISDCLHSNVVIERVSYAEELLDIELLSFDPITRDGDPKHVHDFNYETHEFVCGHCSKPTSGFVIAKHMTFPIKWLICLNCKKGSVFDEDAIHPYPLLGEPVEGLPDIIKTVYDEARKSFSSNSYTACDLVCRKILMNIAVHKGADEGLKFEQYIDCLEESGYITPNMKQWVDIIRQNGNQATHEIKTPKKKRAENTLAFTTQLLKLVYETEHNSNKFTS